MNDRKFAGIVEDCLLRIDRGENFYQILDDYPHCQQRLKILLLVAMASRAFPLPVPSHTALRLGKVQMLEEMENLRAQGAFRKSPEVPAAARLAANLTGALRSSGYTRLAPSYRLAMLAVALFMSGGYLTLSASASSQPGDMLYVLKQSLERVQQVFMVPAALEADLLPALDAVSESEAIPPRTSGRSIWVINGHAFQVNQDNSPGVGAEAQAQADESSPDPVLIESKHGNRKGKADTEDEVAEVMGGDQGSGSGQQENPGKALGKEKPKENQGKALGKDKPNENQGKSNK